MMRRYALAIFGLSRPLILLGMVLVQGLGTAIAIGSGHRWDWGAFLWGYVALVFCAVSVNFVNEYADIETDRLTTKTRYSGGSGVLPKGLVPRWVALAAGWASASAGIVIAALGVAAGALSWAALGVLALGTFLGWMYSLPPLKLAWNGLCEAGNAFIGGMILPLYGYSVLARTADVWVLWACLPYALLLFTTAMATSYPDRAADQRVGKRTLATWLDARALRRIYALASVLSFVALGVLAVRWLIPPQVLVTSFVALPAVVIGYRAYTWEINPHAAARASMILAFAQTAAWAWVGWA